VNAAARTAPAANLPLPAGGHLQLVPHREREGLPREARDGLIRAWLEILRERHPGVTWTIRDSEPKDALVEPVPEGNATAAA
jgi:hypothetical protein